MADLIIRLRRLADGLEREVFVALDEGPLDEEGTTPLELVHYQWREGNFACDCNRRREFVRAGGEPDPEPNPCTDGEFAIVSPDWLRESSRL